MPGSLESAGQFQDHVLGLTDDEDVKEVGDRFGVERAMPAADDEGHGDVPVGAAERDPGQVHQFQAVGIELFVRGADGQDVEGADGLVALANLLHPESDTP